MVFEGEPSIGMPPSK